VLFLFIGIAHGQLVDKNDPGYIQVMGVGKNVDEAKSHFFDCGKCKFCLQ
jgi:hypothetical protein